MQVNYESQPDLVEGIKELIIRRTEPVFRSSLMWGEMELIIMHPVKSWTAQSMGTCSSQVHAQYAGF